MSRRLPGHNEDVQKIDQSFKEFLSEQRKTLTDGGQRKRRKKTAVAPGKSIGNISSNDENSEDEDNNLEAENQGSDRSELDMQPPLAESSPVPGGSHEEVPSTTTNHHKATPRNISKEIEKQDLPLLDTSKLIEGKFIIVLYTYFIRKKKNTRSYVGVIQEKFANKIYVKFLRQYQNRKNEFHFPQKDDFDYVKFDNVIRILPNPEEIRGVYIFPEEIL